MNLYPGILTDSLEELQEQISVASDSSDVSVVHVDIIDGYFTDTLTISPLDLTQIEFGDLQIDFHLSVEEPMDFVHEIIGIKDYLPIRAIIAQVERMSFQEEFLAEVKRYQWKAGLSLNLHTPVSAIDASSWSELDIAQVMTIETGSQGKEFNALALQKIPLIRAKSLEAIELIVDGGVKENHIEQLEELDVESIVVGSGIWDPHAALDHFSELVQTDE
jgi:pentose-5-phosphate-3-epimerase